MSLPSPISRGALFHETIAERLQRVVLGAQLASRQMGLRAERGQVGDTHHHRHGFRMIPRSEFLHILGEDAGEGCKPGRWSVEATPDEVASWQSETGQAA
ncbi:MAG: hypothetical protein QNK17_04560 [Hyphomicrobiaceae bacterium]|nr:hypothetical protein [Hyphomicrobiaceae bacterium]